MAESELSSFGLGTDPEVCSNPQNRPPWTLEGPTPMVPRALGLEGRRQVQGGEREATSFLE